MTSIAKPAVAFLDLERNALGLTVRDYEGEPSTLCAGCGHDALAAALVSALWELSIPPHRLVKLSGIGCSSKMPTYIARGAHGFNAVHGRMAPIATGASAANRGLCYLGVSGDGDSLSIGLGHLAHAMRRNLQMAYVHANNGVYGLTKGQLSASADPESRSRRGAASSFPPIDPILLGLSIGATFLARGFSGDKAHLVPILKAALEHRGFAFVDVISPCVQFNNHEGSTKSYAYVRGHELVVDEVGFDGGGDPSDLADPEGVPVRLHAGEHLRLRAVPPEYDPRDRTAVAAFVEEHRRQGEIPTGLLFLDEDTPGLHERLGTADALNEAPFTSLCPGAAALDELQDEFR